MGKKITTREKLDRDFPLLYPHIETVLPLIAQEARDFQFLLRRLFENQNHMEEFNHILSSLETFPALHEDRQIISKIIEGHNLHGTSRIIETRHLLMTQISSAIKENNKDAIVIILCAYFPVFWESVTSYLDTIEAHILIKGASIH